MARKNLVKILIILAILAWSFWKLYPTVYLQTLSPEEIDKLKLEGKYDKLQANAIKRGLDLQGGIYMVLEVDLPQLVTDLAKNKDETFYEIINECKEELKKNPDARFLDIMLQKFRERKIPLNRYFGTRLDSDEDIIKQLDKEANDAIDRSLQILRNRVDQFGVSEPNIQKRGNRRIVVELPGIQNIERAKDLIGKTALLEFRMLIDPDVTTEVLKKIDEAVKAKRQKGKVPEELSKEKPKPEQETAKKDTTKEETIRAEDLFGGKTDTTATAEDTTALEVNKEFFQEHPFLSLLRDFRSQGGEIAVPQKNRYAVEKILSDPDIQKLIPPDAEFLWSAKPIPYRDDYYWQLYLVKKEPELTGKYLTDAKVQIGSASSFQSAGKPIVAFQLNSEGARIFARVTGANINKRMAIVLDRHVYSAPVIRSKIPRGSGIIEGIGDMQEAQEIAIVLRAGALPAPVHIIEERTVGPSLGADSIRKGTQSAIIGLIIVVLFMIFYYRLGGVIADVALIMNLIIILAVLAGFHFTLTLPGVAGIILTIGMAVDANVLIFERIREELRAGKTVRAAIDTGYSRAFSAILDANVTTLITAVVLYQFGTGPIRGFALTLSIGILTSMFTALVVTRVIFDYLTSKFQIKKLAI
ncbi:MAG TPA: protein translocase subunit SecD [Bacteroidetes bacterium]|nr:protein translocase subunit SecD [Bacteroidota bacterium]